MMRSHKGNQEIEVLHGEHKGNLLHHFESTRAAEGDPALRSTMVFLKSHFKEPVCTCMCNTRITRGEDIRFLDNIATLVMLVGPVICEIVGFLPG